MNHVASSSSPPGSGDVNQSTSTQGKPQDIASEAQDKAREAAGKAQQTLREQLDQRAKQAGEQVAGTAEDLRSVGEELRKQGKEGPAKIADRTAEQTEKVGSYLSRTGSDQMLHDVEDFGRQRPWAMLAGGLALGAVAARFLKASSRGRYQRRSAASGAPGVLAASPSQTQPPAPPEDSVERTEAPAIAGAPRSRPSTPEPTGSPVVGP